MGRGKIWVSRRIVQMLGLCILFEAALFASLCSQGRGAFLQFVSSADTSGYTVVSLGLAKGGFLPASPRTPGYPLFLSIFYLLGGEAYGLHLAIAAQLLINVALCWLGWQLLERSAARVPERIRLAAILFLFWAGLGMALYLLSDLLAAFFFAVFLYGMLYWRRPSLLALSAISLAVATLLRPTFTFLPLLLPLAPFLLARFSSRLPWAHVAVYALASMSGTAISVAYQYRSYEYVGPSSILAQNIEGFLYHALSESRMPRHEHARRFRSEIATRAQVEYEALSKSLEEKHAREFLLEQWRAQSGGFFLYSAKTCLKYLFGPVESLLQRILTQATSGDTYLRYFRLIPSLLCLPVWLLALLLPARARAREHGAYYLLIMLFLAYIVGISIINPSQGERIRFPLLAFPLPLAVWSADELRRTLRRRPDAPGSAAAPPLRDRTAA